MGSIAYSRDDEGIVTLTLDAPGEAVNTIDSRFQADLGELVGRLESERDRIVGIVITSAKSTFCSGADLHPVLTLRPEDAGRFFDQVEAYKAILRRLERLGRPVAAAINGSALGGGLELALSCHHRVCTDDPRPGSSLGSRARTPAYRWSASACEIRRPGRRRQCTAWRKPRPSLSA